MKIYMGSYDKLPAWVDKDTLNNNGSGKEWANYLIIEDGAHNRVYSDAMEPEDATFCRDLYWIADELQTVYNAGLRTQGGE
jgi:hypothetical protein